MRLPLFSLLTSFLLASAASPALEAQAPALPAGAAHYTLVQANDGKAVGSADYTVTAAPNGYQVSSQGDLKMAKFTYTFTDNNRLDGQLNIVHAQLSGTVNGAQVTFNLASDATGRQFQVDIAAQGKNTTNSFDRHQNTVLLPDLDPAAYVAMTHFALAHPPTAWIVIPKENGVLVPAEYTDQPDARATWHGQSTVVHHTSVVVSAQNAVTVELYYRSDGQLLEADLPEQNFYVIQDGFKLENRPHYAPPRGSAPPPQQPGAPQQPPQGGPPQPAPPQT